MPKNKFGGNKAKKGKNQQESKELIKKDSDEQQYAKITKVLGNCRFELISLDDGKKRTGHMRGKLKKRAWTRLDDVVLISLRDFQDDKCDIIHKYEPGEVKELFKLGELKEMVVQKEETCSFEFEKEIDDDDDENPFTFDEI